jgi:hypothetical protein
MLIGAIVAQGSVVARCWVPGPSVSTQAELAPIPSEPSSVHPVTTASTARHFRMRHRFATGAPLQPRETTRRDFRNRDTWRVLRDAGVVIFVACHRAVVGLSL